VARDVRRVRARLRTIAHGSSEGVKLRILAKKASDVGMLTDEELKREMRQLTAESVMEASDADLEAWLAARATARHGTARPRRAGRRRPAATSELWRRASRAITAAGSRNTHAPGRADAGRGALGTGVTSSAPASPARHRRGGRLLATRTTGGGGAGVPARPRPARNSRRAQGQRQGRSSGVSAAAAGAGWRALTALWYPEARRV
jgi:hypothetical protein